MNAFCVLFQRRELKYKVSVGDVGKKEGNIKLYLDNVLCLISSFWRKTQLVKASETVVYSGYKSSANMPLDIILLFH